MVTAPGGEGVLANFFNSLLHKKTGASPGSPMGTAGSPKPGGPESLPDKAAMRSDAAAELDRLARGKKPLSGSSSGVDFNASDCWASYLLVINIID